MWASALLQTSLVLWLAQQTLQAGIKPINWGTKDVGVVGGPEAVGTGLKPGGIPVAATWFGNKAMKTGIGRPWTKFGGGNIRVIGVGGKTRRPVYAAGHGTHPAPGGPICYGCNGGRPPFGAGGYMGASLGAGGYGAGLGQGGYPGGAAAGKLGRYGEAATGYLGAGAANGYGYGNGYSNGLGTGGYAGQGQGVYGGVGAGLDTAGHTYGGDDTFQDVARLMYPESKFNGMNGGPRNGYKG